MSQQHHLAARRFAIVVAAAALCGCADAEVGPPCAGQSRACRCVDGAAGVQSCDPATRAWGRCSCGSPPDVHVVGAVDLGPRGRQDSTSRAALDGQASSPDGWAPPAPDSQPQPPDHSPPTCAGSLFDAVLRIGQTSTVKSGSQQLLVKLSDVGTTGTQPAALLELDGNPANLHVVALGDSVSTASGFVVLVADLQNKGAASDRWARVCVSHP